MDETASGGRILRDTSGVAGQDSPPRHPVSVPTQLHAWPAANTPPCQQSWLSVLPSLALLPSLSISLSFVLPPSSPPLRRLLPLVSLRLSPRPSVAPRRSEAGKVWKLFQVLM